MRTRIPCLPHLIRSAAPTADLVPDRSLVAEFVSSRSGIAFELLVRRHGPAVWAVCRRHLANAHDAEDAFQATFLVLARSAKRISKSNSVGSWLLGVAYRVALKARRTTARRKRVEAVVTPADEPAVLPVQPTDDVTAIVHAELERLPDRYRLPLLLCDLEGLSRKEASAQLGWSEGTLSGRLNRARKLLAGRLTGRGVAAGLVVGLAGFAVPSYAATVAATSAGMTVFDTSISAAPEAVAALARGAIRDMTRTFVMKLSAGMLAAGLLVAGGVVGLRFDTPAQAAPVPKDTDKEKAKPEDVTDSLAQLVVQPAVQRELKLTADQRVKLIDGFDKLEAEMEKAMNAVVPDGPVAFPALPGGGGQAVPPPQAVPVPAPGGPDGTTTTTNSGPNPWEKQIKAQRDLVADTLTKGQLKRLQQCEVQVLGPLALKLKRVADELKLTDDQKKDVEKAMQNMGFGGGVTGGPAIELPVQVVPPGGQQGGGVAPGFPGPNVGSEPMVSPDDALAEIVKGFSAAQTKAWKELAGEKVGFDKQRVQNRWPGYWSVIAPPMDGREDGGTGSTPAAPPVVAPGFPGGGVQILPAPAQPPLPAQPVAPPGNPGK